MTSNVESPASVLDGLAKAKRGEVIARIGDVRFEPAYSLADGSVNLWSYTVMIFNNSAHPIKVISRDWNFRQKTGDTVNPLRVTHSSAVEKPIILPNDVFFYRSGVPLTGQSWSMQGHVGIMRVDGVKQNIAIDPVLFDKPHRNGEFTRPTNVRLSAAEVAAIKAEIECFNSRIKAGQDAVLRIDARSSKLLEHASIAMFSYVVHGPTYNTQKRRNGNNGIKLGRAFGETVEFEPIESTDIFLRESEGGLSVHIENRKSPDSLTDQIELLLTNNGFEANSVPAFARAMRETLRRLMDPDTVQRESNASATRAESARPEHSLDGLPRALPDKAPKLYAERPKGQNVIDFLRDPEGWGPYVKAGLLTRPDLRRLDLQAYTALDNWLRKGSFPPDVQIPKKSEVTDRLIEAHPNPLERPARLQYALASRVRRAGLGQGNQ